MVLPALWTTIVKILIVRANQMARISVLVYLHMNSWWALWVLIWFGDGCVLRISGLLARSRRHFYNRSVSVFTHDLLYRTFVITIRSWNWSRVLRSWSGSRRCILTRRLRSTSFITVYFTARRISLRSSVRFANQFALIVLVGWAVCLRLISEIFRWWRRRSSRSTIMLSIWIWNGQIRLWHSIWIVILQITTSATSKIETLVVAQFEVSVINDALLRLQIIVFCLQIFINAAKFLVLARPIREVPVLLFQLRLFTLPQIAPFLQVQFASLIWPQITKTLQLLWLVLGRIVIQEIVLLWRPVQEIVGAAQFQWLLRRVGINHLLAAALQWAGEYVIGNVVIRLRMQWLLFHTRLTSLQTFHPMSLIITIIHLIQKRIELRWLNLLALALVLEIDILWLHSN